MTSIRRARETDLSQMYEVFYQNEVLDTPHPPLPGDLPSYLHHVLQTGAMYVVEQDGEVLAFTGAITRGTVTFLTDLFVHPAHHSSQLGKTLLSSVLPQDDLAHCTVSSSDLRALALYIRAGMRPLWPYFALRREKSAHEWRWATDMEFIEADPGDPALIHWDAQISGRWRPQDHRYWVREQQAVPLWFRRRGHIVGYGYIRLDAGTLWHPHTCTIGPIGVRDPEEAADCVLTAVNWALQRADVLHIDVLGPHPCLAALLQGGFRILYVDTFVSTADPSFFDARCYIASGGDLF